MDVVTRCRLSSARGQVRVLRPRTSDSSKARRRERKGRKRASFNYAPILDDTRRRRRSETADGFFFFWQGSPWTLPFSKNKPIPVSRPQSDRTRFLPPPPNSDVISLLHYDCAYRYATISLAHDDHIILFIYFTGVHLVLAKVSIGFYTAALFGKPADFDNALHSYNIYNTLVCVFVHKADATIFGFIRHTFAFWASCPSRALLRLDLTATVKSRTVGDTIGFANILILATFSRRLHGDVNYYNNL